MQDIKTDYIVVGSGIAGLRAAIELSKYGKVHVITKDTPTESSSEYAQGGVAVALSDEDEVGIHFEDTIKAGDGLCNEEAVRVLVKEGPDRIIELIQWGAEFDRKDSELSFTLEAAHSRRRILHAKGDSTGREIMRVLIDRAKSRDNITKIPFCIALDLIVEEGQCRGLIAASKEGLIYIYGRATIISTGGAGQVYLRTTNPEVATGDGIAMAYRAGATLMDMEFVQFHPTVLYAPSAPQFLLSEAMRGEGAVLRDINKYPFMADYHPKAELAPRDVVSRAIISQTVKTGASHVYLDLSHLESAFVKGRFPRIYETCMRYGVDITRDLIPVSPAAHYIMGGIKTDINGATDVRGLYAAGEAACTGVHGANRLASNSLLEGLVFGCRAAISAAHAHISPPAPLQTGAYEIAKSRSEDQIKECIASLKRVMWEKAGIIRCDKSLSEAKAALAQFMDVEQCRCTNRACIEFKNMLMVSSLIVESALYRKGSLGGHYRSDYKSRGTDWKRHTAVKNSDGGMFIIWI